MSLFRPSATLPHSTVAMRFSPWFLVGSALILGLAIAFWAVKNARQERENMSDNLLDRAQVLIWTMEGSARVGMNFRSSPAHLQFLLEEIAKRPDIAYLAVITPQGEILAHSDPARIGEDLYPAEYMTGISPAPVIHWRVMRAKGAADIFEAYTVFAPWPGFREHIGAHGVPGRAHRKADPDSMQERAGESAHDRGQGAGLFAVPRFGIADGLFSVDRPAMRKVRCGEIRNELIMVIGLDMTPFEKSLAMDLRNTVVTAFLVGLLGLGGFLSLFWAQSYRFSRRLLLDTRAFADKVVGSLPIGLVILDAEERVIQTNEVADKILGRGGPELLGKKAGELEGMDWERLVARVFRSETVRPGEAVLDEEHTLVLAGTDEEQGVKREIPVSLSVSRIHNDEGECLGMLILLRDLREVKRLQAELRRSERLSTLGNMAARVAHEIRNPLSSIKGFATYLGARQTDEADSEAARIMIGEVERLNRVVSELLGFARPSSLNITSSDPYDILERVVRLVEMDAQAKGIVIDLRSSRELAPPGGPSAAPWPQVAVDAERIIQALLNLLLNAVQATESGGSVSISLLRPKQGRVGISIVDTGPGMAPEVLVQIFTPYFTTRVSGSGLGLSIVHKIVDDHGGEIFVTSEPGKGTTVTVWLPLADEDGSLSAKIPETPSDRVVDAG